MTKALIIFLITYLIISIRRLPFVKIDRPAGALIGAVSMVIFGVLSIEEAYAAVDFNTIALLLGMMVIIAYLRLSGFFELAATRILNIARTPRQLLTLVVLTSGVLSALFVNDTICLIFTPILLAVIQALRLNPMPYLIALATSSNIGSVMTITGNPQNMYIGVQSSIPFVSFFLHLFPVTLVGFALNVLVVGLIYRRDINDAPFAKHTEIRPQVDRTLLIKSLGIGLITLMSFIVGAMYPLAAMTGAAVLIVIAFTPPEEAFKVVDWTLLLFFSGLFVVMRGIEKAGLAALLMEHFSDAFSQTGVTQIFGVSFVSLLLSNLVSNVPAVMLLKPLVETASNPTLVWLTLAMSSTLAGNLTLIGSVANLIVAQQAEPKAHITFMEYLKVGAPLTLVSTIVGALILALYL
jgi:Na+/H+ antiporter NhaD/arsenite permease-like protein